MTMLESRTDVQKRISQAVGQTNNDREDHIPYLLVQLKKDMAVLVEALSIASQEILYYNTKKIYTIREFIVFFSPHDSFGLKALLCQLYNERRCLAPPSTFIKKLKAYKLSFPQDTRINGEEVPRDYSLKQMHMQRHVLTNNREITSYFKDLHESRLLKKQNDIIVEYAAVSKYLLLNQEMENKLCTKI